MKEHWENVYKRTEVNKLGWYEEDPQSSLKLIARCNLNKDSKILNVGAGATTLIDELLKLGYTNIVANDLSRSALDKLQERLGKHLSKNIKWIVDDLINPKLLNSYEQIDLWIDRAVLHFFNEPDQQNRYFKLLNKMVKPGGYTIIASFNLDGAEKCSDLPVHRYNREMLEERLGIEFKHLESFNHTYIMPSGNKREYIYTLFQRS